MAIYLSEAVVRQALPMAQAIEAVQRAFIERAKGEAFDVPRVRTRLPGGHLHILQGASTALNLVGYKAYYIRPDQSRTSLLHLIDRERGNLVAVIDSDYLGQIRTGAATAVAARALARDDAQVLGLFGAGRHAATQLAAIAAVKRLRSVKVYSRNPEKRAEFCTRMGRELGIDVRPADSAQEAVKGSDMVVAMTRSKDPVFDGRWLEAGQFVAATGSNALDRREIDEATVLRADVLVVDSREVARGESGDLLSAFENGHLYWENIADLGEVLIGRRAGRTDPSQVTLFESHGMALQDIHAGALVLDAARAQGLGVELPY
ncbi:MAG TPA: ornithine cyclodeaminase family protein [Ramlibacter sp.]|jgi:ornithine cyclodeaminase